ncbi:hypothetical protein [Streptomyces sp. NPDC048392]|uniref:hypothetical protein n=1 Tax=Streptomyces sp. NPDC048392 TaxID=3365543 RepID=UPI0037177D21
MTDDVPSEENRTADDSRPAKDEFPQTEIEMHYVDSLPGGKVVMPFERDGALAWFVVRGEISLQAGRELLGHMNHLVHTGLWEQNWRGPQPGD